MEETLYYEHIMMENVLYNIIQAIKEGPYSEEQKEKYIQEAFEKFLQEAKGYKGCPGFKNMTVDQLRKEYERLMGKEHQEER